MVVRSRAVRGRLSVCPLSASMRAVGVGVLGEGCAGLPVGGITVKKRGGESKFPAMGLHECPKQ